MFRVIEECAGFNVGEIVSLKEDDGSDNPYFWKEDKSDYCPINFSKLEPVTKTARDAQVRDAQVGDIVVRSKGEHMVLKRLKKIVLLSYSNNFKRMKSTRYTFDELEENYTLKNAPDVKSAKTAEAMKLLKEAGYKVIKD